MRHHGGRVAPGSADGADPATWVVDAARMGPIELGMSEEALRDAVAGLPFQAETGGGGQPALHRLVVEADGEMGLFQVSVDAADGVEEMTLITGETSVRTVYGSLSSAPAPQVSLSAFPRTSEGIGIGSSLADAYEAYPGAVEDDLFGDDGATRLVTEGTPGASPTGLVLSITGMTQTPGSGVVDAMTVTAPSLAVPCQTPADPATWHATGMDFGTLWPDRPWSEIAAETRLVFAGLAPGADPGPGPAAAELRILPVAVDGRRGDIVAYLDETEGLQGSALLFLEAPLETDEVLEPLELSAMPYGLEGLTVGSTRAELEEFSPGAPSGGSREAPAPSVRSAPFRGSRT